MAPNFKSAIEHTMFKKQITLLFFMTVFYIKAFATDSDITEKSQISYVFKDINSNQTLSQHNHHIYMHPASCQKIITALAGLKILGRDYQFSTQVISKKKAAGPNWQSDLELRFSGDPTFSEADLATLAKKLKINGIENIIGDIIINSTAFDNQNFGPGWMIDDQGQCYQHPYLLLY